MTELAEKILAQPAGATTSAEALFERSPAALLVLGANGATLRANAAAHALFRCGNDTLAGVSAALLFPELWKGGDRESVALSGSSASHRVLARRPDGSTFPARLRFSSTCNEPGAALIASIEDETEIDRALAAAQSDVTAANKEFESFVDVAAHDLRAPLRILSGFTEALEDECGNALNEEGRTFLKEILTASGRMEGIIDGLLALARSARAEMHCERLDMSTLIELVFYELRHSDALRSVDCRVEPELVAWGDVRLMMTVLRNLIGNAWKFTARSGSPSIRLYRETRDDGPWICITDNGAGFDMSHATRLFKPFTRLHRQDEFPGHGIGLATVHRILRRHGGRIEADARPGEGATFRFWLPPEP